MIIGGSKKEVVENIKKYTESGELNHKVEVGDPVFSSEESAAALKNFYNIRKNKIIFMVKSFFAYQIIGSFARKMSKNVEVKGLENFDLKELNGRGAVVTVNHFNPLDSLGVQKALKKKRVKKICFIAQETNLKLPGMLGFIFNYLNVLPLSKNVHYLQREFKPRFKSAIDAGEFILIYPEEEMWFNYKKPRPVRRGAYQFAAESDAPILSCFTEIREVKGSDSKPVADNDEFYETKYVTHILGVIKPDRKLSIRENAKKMAEKDYWMKVAAYEKIYGEKLDYKFKTSDIAGWRK